MPTKVMLAAAALVCAGAQEAAARKLEPIAYVISIPDPSTHEIVVQATVPATGGASLDLMMPTWSPGYYRVEDYAANVREVSAETIDGQPLVVEKTNGNHWRVDARGSRAIKLSYRVFCNQRTVTTTAAMTGLDDAPDGRPNALCSCYCSGPVAAASSTATRTSRR